MSTLTKIFNVLQLVFALVTAVMLIMFVSAAAPYKLQVATGEQRVAAAQIALAANQAELSKVSATLASLTNENTTAAAGWKRRLDELQAQITTLSKEKADLTVLTTNLEANNRAYAATIESLKNQNLAQAEELKKTRPDIANYIQRYSEVARKNEELTQQLASATRAIRRLQEELAAQAEAAATKASAAGPATGGQVNTLGGVQTPSQVNGKITRVESNNGRTFITMPLGKRDGVRENTQFVVYRGNQYIGDAVVRTVSVNECVAVVTLTKEGASVQPGDMVISGQNP